MQFIFHEQLYISIELSQEELKKLDDDIIWSYIKEFETLFENVEEFVVLLDDKEACYYYKNEKPNQSLPNYVIDFERVKKFGDMKATIKTKGMMYRRDVFDNDVILLGKSARIIKDKRI